MALTRLAEGPAWKEGGMNGGFLLRRAGFGGVGISVASWRIPRVGCLFLSGSTRSISGPARLQRISISLFVMDSWTGLEHGSLR